MKTVVDFFQTKSIIFKDLKIITPKELGSRKKLDLYLGVDMRSFYTIIMKIEKKSIITSKDIKEFEILHQKLEKYIDSKITKKYIIINTSLSSKVKKTFLEKGWKVWNDL